MIINVIQNLQIIIIYNVNDLILIIIKLNMSINLFAFDTTNTINNKIRIIK